MEGRRLVPGPVHDEADCREIVDDDDWWFGHHRLVEIWEVPGTTFVLPCIACGQNAVHTRDPQPLFHDDGAPLLDADGRQAEAPGMSIWLTCRGLPLCRTRRCRDEHVTRRARPAQPGNGSVLK